MYIKPVDTLLDPFRKYAQFRGRAPRAEFWLFLLVGMMCFKLVDIGFYMTAERDQKWSLEDRHPRIWISAPQIAFDSAHSTGNWRHWKFKRNRDGANKNGQHKPSGVIPKTAISSCTAFYDNISVDSRYEYLCVESADGKYRAAARIYLLTAYWFGAKTLLTLCLFLPFIALLSRRLHDCGRSGWWMLLLAFPPTALLLLIYCGFGRSADKPSTETKK